MSNFSHLDPGVRDQLDLPAEERAGRMLAERFITHERLVPILNYIEFLIHMPPQTRASGLVVSGKPGSGKTMLSRAIQRRYPPTPAENGKVATQPVLVISMTNAREAKTALQPDPERVRGARPRQLFRQRS
ncbi:MAG: TniB family NTP-binding protein [Luteimonas sp.]|nr:TniB family NTP-binding protein [Luteimonas sp.]